MKTSKKIRNTCKGFKLWKHWKMGIAASVILGLPGCLQSSNDSPVSQSKQGLTSLDLIKTIEKAPNKIKVSSVAFAEGGKLALQQAHGDCGGQNISPPLSWSGVPPKARSVAIVVSDADAPGGAWTHWIIYNLPASRKNIGVGIAPGEVVPSGARQAKNDWGVAGYGGPCPPSGKHRYRFYVLALDLHLSLPENAGQAEFSGAISNHILARGVLAGSYSRN
jgi:Raf kinase inhibitor-like YbhB/YbcL family protein